MIADKPAAAVAKAGRLESLDVLRGFDMFWIIGGGAMFTALARALDVPVLNALVPQFDHVPWAGLHAWDVIWPLFMFIVGAAIPFSIANRRAAGATDRSLILHGVRRAAILFVLGMAAQGNLFQWSLAKLWPCYSVLHGIAAGYLIALVVVVRLRPGMQVVKIVACLLLFWALVAWAPVPGVGAGVLTPEGNFATWVDRVVLGRFHHGTNTWFVSYLGFASSVLLGALAGHVLRSARTAQAKIRMLAAAGAGCLAIGLLWSLVFPIIKLLWTSSFVLVAGGISFLAMALFYWIVDVRGWRAWGLPFRVIGANSIVAYMAMMLFPLHQVGNIFVGGLLPRVGPWRELLSESAAFVVLWLVLYWMYRKKTFVKI